MVAVLPLCGDGKEFHPPHDAVNKFLGLLGITFRRDKTGRPRINKPGSYLDREQKAAGEYYYYNLDMSALSDAEKEDEDETEDSDSQ